MLYFGYYYSGNLVREVCSYWPEILVTNSVPLGAIADSRELGLPGGNI